MTSDSGAGGPESAQWALRFISGKYQGGEFPLRPHREIVIGRSSDLDMVLVEDMVSRKHAKIITDERTVSIQDLGSTNAMFETEARSKMQVTANKRPAAKSMSGSIEEIPLPDLLQLLSTSRKSGVV